MTDRRNDLEKTQEMPAVADKTMLLPPELRQSGKLYGERVMRREGQQVALPKRRSRQMLVYVGGFLAAVIVGYAVFNYSLADIQRSTQDYATAANDKKIELQAKQAELTDTLNRAQASIDAVKNQTDVILAENEGLLAAIKAFVLEQQTRLQEFFNQDNSKK